MELGLSDKVAVITGGSKGIGAATARLLAAEGARLVLAARGAEALSALAAELERERKAKATTVAVDLTQPGSAERVRDAALAAFGRIDILVTSAGSSQGGLFWEIPDKVWEESLALKLMGTVRTLRAIVPLMVAQKAGRTVVVVGSAGRQPDPRFLPGGAANAALLNITRGLAEEVASYGVIVNAVSPGPVRTQRWTTLVSNLSKSTGKSVAEIEGSHIGRIPLGRLGEPEEMARLIAFLASDAAGFVTGTSLTADGGATKAIA